MSTNSSSSSGSKETAFLSLLLLSEFIKSSSISTSAFMQSMRSSACSPSTSNHSFKLKSAPYFAFLLKVSLNSFLMVLKA